MSTIIRQKSTLGPTPDRATHMAPHEYFLIKPGDKPGLGIFDYASTSNSNIGLMQLNAVTAIRGTIPKGWISIIIKPFGHSGIGSISQSSGRSTTIRVLSSQQEDWTAETANSDFYIISIRGSLLAKHALGVVDTNLLMTPNTHLISASTSSLMIDRIQHISRVSQQSAELDLRVSHLMLAVCEAISELPNKVPQKNRDRLTQHAMQLIQKDDSKYLSITKLAEQLEIGERRLDSAFKAKLDVTCSQFINAYKLNLVRKDLYLAKRDFSQCVNFYEFQNADQLYRRYMKLFGEEPPIAIQSPLLPRANTLRRVLGDSQSTEARERMSHAIGGITIN